MAKVIVHPLVLHMNPKPAPAPAPVKVNPIGLHGLAAAENAASPPPNPAPASGGETGYAGGNFQGQGVDPYGAAQAAQSGGGFQVEPWMLWAGGAAGVVVIGLLVASAFRR